MHKLLTILTLLMVAVFIGSVAHASDERPDHFKGKTVETIEQAKTNITEYNRQMAKILAADKVSVKDMLQIHKITYTLENALQHIDEQIEKLQEELEEIHLASERNDSKTIRRVAPGYLSTSKQLFD